MADGQLPLANMLSCPQQGLWIEWLPCADQETQAVERMRLGMLRAKFHKHAESGGGTKDPGDTEFLDRGPDNVLAGVMGCALAPQDRDPLSPRAIDQRR